VTAAPAKPSPLTGGVLLLYISIAKTGDEYKAEQKRSAGNGKKGCGQAGET